MNSDHWKSDSIEAVLSGLALILSGILLGIILCASI